MLSLYKDDADRLAVNNVVFSQQLYTDSVVIDPNLRTKFLNALVAVHNATTLAARDTVVPMYHIHRINEDLHAVFLQADSNLTWLKNLHNNLIPTGNQQLDFLMNKYFLQKNGYYTFNSQYSYHICILKTDTNFNMYSLSAQIAGIPGVNEAQPV